MSAGKHIYARMNEVSVWAIIGYYTCVAYSAVRRTLWNGCGIGLKHWELIHNNPPDDCKPPGLTF